MSFVQIQNIESRLAWLRDKRNFIDSEINELQKQLLNLIPADQKQTFIMKNGEEFTLKIATDKEIQNYQNDDSED